MSEQRMQPLTLSDVGQEVTALIPAAAVASDAADSVHSAALLPMAGRPVVQWTVEYLISVGIRKFIIAVRPGATAVKDIVQTLFGRDAEVSFIEVETSTVGETVLSLAHACQTKGALVVLGDTYFRFADVGTLLGSQPVLLTAPVADSFRWCVARTSPIGEVVELIDKQPGLPGQLDALIGVYWLPSVQHLREAAESVASRSPKGSESLSFTEVLTVLNARVTLRAERAGEWFDAGNPDRRAAASRSLLAHRAFNSLEVDDLTGTITKRSTDVAKFINEINYLRSLPPDIAVLFPRLVDSSTSADDPWMTMEFYGYPTLAELFLYHRLDRSVWHRVFTHLSDIVWERFAAAPRSIASSDVRAMFLGKVWERFDSLRSNDVLARMLDCETVIVNGKPLVNLPVLRQELGRRVDALAEDPMGAVVHGDLCLSNVLYDLRSSICRLIDPRGSFGEIGVGGDLRYDVAKLWHSVHGWYDLITADLFSLEVAGSGEAVLDVRVRADQEAVADAFREVFFDRFDATQITLVAGLILCGIPALHYDHPDRQVAMYLRGLVLVNEALEVGE